MSKHMCVSCGVVEVPTEFDTCRHCDDAFGKLEQRMEDVSMAHRVGADPADVEQAHDDWEPDQESPIIGWIDSHHCRSCLLCKKSLISAVACFFNKKCKLGSNEGYGWCPMCGIPVHEGGPHDNGFCSICGDPNRKRMI